MGNRGPGVLLSAVVAGLALAVAALEEAAIGRPVIEALVIAILIGMTVRSLTPSWTDAAEPGVRLVGKDLLELAVCLLGATMDLPRLFAAGAGLAVGIVVL